MNRWEQGRATVDDLIQRREVEKVPASAEHAQAELAQARQHLASAKLLLDVDPVGAYSLAYDAARKALAAVLMNQGLRATSRGGHVAVYETVKAQLDPPLGGVLRPFSRMRIRRNESEYRSAEAPAITPEEVSGDLPKAQAIIDLAEKAMPHMSRY
ncbi:uncharacterized protein (UPF0332 family) [Kitasatospora sp. MAA19]|uniref:hypothetical protein n=1 Tax=unclassified Kitasatospora TaxID=2633591 RepID=UPI00247385AE|nr:hypothetical protein [Kitasatospora sp. MAA19]MDH6703788.1 uncharacterized protein (UPF0332 family) [Kitasatospora sp. MAA19]